MVYLPAIESQPDAVPSIRREEIVRGGTETILLAEDEEAIRALAERILTGLGYTVLVARNGEEAVEIFRKNNAIALAVLDVVMPRKGGKEAFEEMHTRNPLLKVIFMSGYSADAIHDSLVSTPGASFLQKPFGPTILSRKVREALDAKQAGRMTRRKGPRSGNGIIRLRHRRNTRRDDLPPEGWPTARGDYPAIRAGYRLASGRSGIVY